MIPPWMQWPRIEAKMYFPRLVTRSMISSISTILLPTRNVMPIGTYLCKEILPVIMYKQKALKNMPFSVPEITLFWRICCSYWRVVLKQIWKASLTFFLGGKQAVQVQKLCSPGPSKRQLGECQRDTEMLAEAIRPRHWCGVLAHWGRRQAKTQS